MLTYDEVTQSEAIRTYITRADQSLAALGYTEHSFAHVMHVAETAKYILETLDFPPRTVELARIAGYLHDIGNLVNRVDHSQSGAVMAWSILNDMGCDPAEIATIVTAIGNHDEGNGVPVNEVAAARQSRRAAEPGAQHRHHHLRHSRPGELLCEKIPAKNQRGPDPCQAEADGRHQIWLCHGLF